jgi:hypothetical protein
MSPRYRYRPNVVAALRWTGANIDEIRAFMHPSPPIPLNGFGKVDDIGVVTSRGLIVIRRNDWVLRSLMGELLTLSDQEFVRTLEPVPDAG